MKPGYVMLYRRKGKSLGTFGAWCRVETRDLLAEIPFTPDPVLALKEREQQCV